MREIKFRGKRVDNGEWIIGFYRKYTFFDKFSECKNELYTKHYIGCFDNLSLFDRIFEQVEVLPETVGQYTGLKDANGVEIYEGDIIQSNKGTISFVVWELNGYRTNSFFDGWHELFYCISKAEAKVIGNMTDNPELLNA